MELETGSTQEKLKKRRHGRVFFVCGAIILGAFIDSAYRIDFSSFEIYSARLPHAFDGFRIAVISDLHGTEFGADNRRLVELVTSQNPDLIVLLGDMIEGAADIPVAERLVGDLCGIAPIYFISGNHDWYQGNMRGLATRLIRYGAIYLHDSYVPIEKDGERLILAGVEDPNRFTSWKTPNEVMHAMRAEYPDDFTLLLGHRNDWMERYPELPVDLVLSGHAHGGLVRLPLVGGVFGNDHTLFPEYDDGLYDNGSYQMFVSRGLDTRFPLIRFLNNPHLPLIVLRCE